MKSLIVGKLLVCISRNAIGAPFIDKAYANDDSGKRYRGYAILLQPWRRNNYGEALPQPALFLTWRHESIKPQQER
jgi:hypothetical protein